MWRHLLRETVPLLTGPCRTAGVSTLSRHTVSSETSTCPEFISFENSPSFLGPEKISLGSMSGAGEGKHGWGGERGSMGGVGGGGSKMSSVKLLY